MAASTPIKWNVDEASELVSIGDRKLYLNAAGRQEYLASPW
jgi:hypothetical protein